MGAEIGSVFLIYKFLHKENTTGKFLNYLSTAKTSEPFAKRKITTLENIIHKHNALQALVLNLTQRELQNIAPHKFV